MLPELIKVIKSKIATIKNYPGQSVVVNGRGLRDMEAESYGLAGVVNLPPDGTRVIYLPYGGTRHRCLHQVDITTKSSYNLFLRAIKKNIFHQCNR